MARMVVYQSPNRDNPNNPFPRSSPIREDDEAARRTLEAAGWTIAEVREEDVEAEPAPLAPVPGVTTNAAGEPAAWSLDSVEGLTPAQVEALNTAGFNSEAAIREATDDDLRGVEGIGPATLRNLRKGVRMAGTTPPPPEG